jgi:signal transduction histidine kinase/CheY-like chemotaxis protein
MKRIKLMVLLSSLALVSLFAIQYYSIKTNLSYNKNIEDMNLRSQKISHVYSVLNLILDIETGLRGYVFTGLPHFLEPYELGTIRLPVELKKLYFYLEPDEVAKLEPLIKYSIEHAKQLIDRKADGKVVTSLDLENGKVAMDGIRKVVMGVIDREEGILRRQTTTLSSNTIIIGLIAISISSFLFIVACMYYVFYEFRQRTLAEKKLKVSLATSKAITRDIDFGIIACDTKGNIIFSNKWILSKIPFLEKVEDFFKSNSSLEEAIKKIISGEIAFLSDVELEFNGHKKIYSIKSSTFYIQNALEGTVLSIMDTTDSTNKMATLLSGKERADFASNAKSDFLAKMSHEIRTPLNSILGVGEILSLTKLNAEQKNCLEIFKRSAVTLNNLVNDILDLSKIEAGKIDIIITPFSLTNLINSCTSIMDFRASQKGLLFTVETDSMYDHFVGDEGRIRQIILNLLSNAVKFTDKGEIKFIIESKETSGSKKEITFIIRDTGRGISPENIDKLFTDYQQENSSISKEFGGTGLGLSLSKELARLMDGEMFISSILGEGSDFSFKISLELAEGTFVEEKIELNLNFNKLKILLVDDNPENRFVVKKYLSNLNVQIKEAIDGDDAITIFQKENFDMILMDINMPKKDGITATKEIRELENNNGIEKTLIIALSANALSLEYTKAMDAGCNDYLTKPLSRMKLVTMMKKWAGVQEQEDIMKNDDFENEEEIDEDIKALIPAYLDSRLKDLETIKNAFAKKDMPIIAKLVHNIKGTALSYGQDKLDVIVKSMEVAIQANKLDEIEKYIQSMETLLRTKNGH